MLTTQGPVGDIALGAAPALPNDRFSLEALTDPGPDAPGATAPYQLETRRTPRAAV